MEQFTLGIGGYAIIVWLVLWALYSLVISHSNKAVKRGWFGTGDGSNASTSIVLTVLLIAGAIWLLQSMGVETK